MDTMTAILWICIAFALTKAHVLQQDRRASHCDILCNDEAGPSAGVCATDGHFYKNLCEFNNAECRAQLNGTHLRKVSNGPGCITLMSDCTLVAQSRCFHYVTGTLDPVCGSDGKTYASSCTFMKHQCDPSSNLTLDHVGKCVPDLAHGARMIDCSQYIIDTTGFAFEEGAHAVLHTIPCPHGTNQTVCAFNNRSYHSECNYCGYLLRLHKIKAGDLKAYIQHDGQCQTKG